MFSLPYLYMIFASNCDINSIHRACRRDKSFCTLKLCSVLWSVYMKKGEPLIQHATSLEHGLLLTTPFRVLDNLILHF